MLMGRGCRKFEMNVDPRGTGGGKCSGPWDKNKGVKAGAEAKQEKQQVGVGTEAHPLSSSSLVLHYISCDYFTRIAVWKKM